MAEFHNHMRIVRGENSYFIVLFHRKKNLIKVYDFRPIFLIGCIYKVIVKVLENRLRKVIGYVILEMKTNY